MSTNMELLKPSSSQIFGPEIPSPRRNSGRVPAGKMCLNVIQPKCAGYLICLAALHEITFGTILIFLNTDELWYRNAQSLVILTCRFLQYPSCFLAIFGIHYSNPSLIVPFMLSQVSLGSYADLHTYIQLVSRCSAESTVISTNITSPIIIIVIPILIYAFILIFFIFNMYKIVKFITISRAILQTSSRNIQSDLFF